MDLATGLQTFLGCHKARAWEGPPSLRGDQHGGGGWVRSLDERHGRDEVRRRLISVPANEAGIPNIYLDYSPIINCWILGFHFKMVVRQK
jgi:hypothetical protein